MGDKKTLKNQDLLIKVILFFLIALFCVFNILLPQYSKFIFIVHSFIYGCFLIASLYDHFFLTIYIRNSFIYLFGVSYFTLLVFFFGIRFAVYNRYYYILIFLVFGLMLNIYLIYTNAKKKWPLLKERLILSGKYDFHGGIVRPLVIIRSSDTSRLDRFNAKWSSTIIGIGTAVSIFIAKLLPQDTLEIMIIMASFIISCLLCLVIIPTFNIFINILKWEKETGRKMIIEAS